MAVTILALGRGNAKATPTFPHSGLLNSGNGAGPSWRPRTPPRAICTCRTGVCLGLVVARRGAEVAFDDPPGILPAPIAGALTWLTHLPLKTRSCFRTRFPADTSWQV